MNICIVADTRTIEDHILGKKAHEGWNERPCYLVNKIMRENGCPVNYRLIEDTFHSAKGDVAMLHLDCTFHSPCQIESASSFNGIMLNQRVIDISKRKVQKEYTSIGGKSLMLSKEESYKGKVIIKSDYNSGDPQGKWYLTMQNEEVPSELWEKTGVIIQKFVASPTGKLKRMDRYVLFLDELVVCSFFSEEDIIKRKTSIWQYRRDIELLERDRNIMPLKSLNESGIFYSPFSEIERRNYQIIKKLAKRMGLDFGSIDTITDENNDLHVLDVNKTPWERGIPKGFLHIFYDAFAKKFRT